MPESGREGSSAFVSTATPIFLSGSIPIRVMNPGKPPPCPTISASIHLPEIKPNAVVVVDLLVHPVDALHLSLAFIGQQEWLPRNCADMYAHRSRTLEEKPVAAAIAARLRVRHGGARFRGHIPAVAHGESFADAGGEDWAGMGQAELRDDALLDVPLIWLPARGRDDLTGDGVAEV